MKFIPQFDQMDCGPACLAMIAGYYGKQYPLSFLRENSYLTREGVSLLGMNQVATKIGFETLTAKLTIEELLEEKIFPCILHWNQNHFVVLKKVKIQKSIFFKSVKLVFIIADPAHGILKISEELFKKAWLSDASMGVAFLLQPGQKFYELNPPKKEKLNVLNIFKYITPFKIEFLQLFCGLLAGSLLMLLLPFLTQALIDRGIGNKDIKTIYLILIAQICLFIGSSVFEIIRNWIILYIGTRINVSIISDFLKKLLSLPIKFFDTKLMGDHIQRIGDHEKIELFLTSQSMITFFSIVNVSVFFIVLAFYNFTILFLYIGLTTISIAWAAYFLNKRKFLDYENFNQRVETSDSIYEIINGMQEIKLNNYENEKRLNWERIQVKLFKIKQKILIVNQYQETGYSFINQLKNMIVTFIAANAVVAGNLTLGAMLSISYIIGQMNSPINQLIAFFRSFQDASISLNRLLEIQGLRNEESPQSELLKTVPLSIQVKRGITIENLRFQYEGPKSPIVLDDLNFSIPEGKITAIVGSSGSGKSTLLKLLLKFYSPINGEILVNCQNLENISPREWRANCGAVMQDGYIFADTIRNNIVTGQTNEVSDELVWKAIIGANIQEYVQSLPLGLNTKLGSTGNGISGGQKQRILIARAMFKNPQYLFFDEATSALDSENEKTIMGNLDGFFKGKTVVIIAHRLSTVKNAHQIIVLNKGRISEIGNHETLVATSGDYFNLVKNQLELSE